jgi:hypothetical protein
MGEIVSYVRCGDVFVGSRSAETEFILRALAEVWILRLSQLPFADLGQSIASRDVVTVKRGVDLGVKLGRNHASTSQLCRRFAPDFGVLYWNSERLNRASTSRTRPL